MHRSGNDFTWIGNLPRGQHSYKFVVDGEWRFAPDQPKQADRHGNINNICDVTNFFPEQFHSGQQQGRPAPVTEYSTKHMASSSPMSSGSSVSSGWSAQPDVLSVSSLDSVDVMQATAGQERSTRGRARGRRASSVSDCDTDDAGTASSSAPRSARKKAARAVPYGNVVPDEDFYAKDPPQLPPQLRAIVLNSAAVTDARAMKRLPAPSHVSLGHLYCTAIKDGLMVLGITQRVRRKFATTVFYSRMPVASGAPVAQGGSSAASGHTRSHSQEASEAGHAGARSAAAGGSVAPSHAGSSSPSSAAVQGPTPAQLFLWEEHARAVMQQLELDVQEIHQQAVAGRITHHQASSEEAQRRAQGNQQLDALRAEILAMTPDRAEEAAHRLRQHYASLRR